MSRRPRDWEDDEDFQPRHRSIKKRTSVWLWMGLGVGALAVVAVVVVILVNQSSGGGAAKSRFRRIPGLVAHWSFDEVEKDRVIDQSGRTNHATLQGGRLDRGASGQGLWLDGRPDQWCDLGGSNDLNFGARDGFTFAGWFTTNEPSATILSLRSRWANTQIDLLVRDGRLIIVVGDDQDPGPQNGFVFARQPNDGQWHHFAFTRNGNAIELFLDGVSQGTGNALNTGGAITTNLRALGSERLWLLQSDGRWRNPACKGGLDDVCVFNRALAAAAIPALMKR